MKIHPLHPWEVTPQEAFQIQHRLAHQVVHKKPDKLFKWIAGADISMNRNSTEAFAGVVILDARTMQMVDEYMMKGTITFPYIPGLLSFREAPLLLKCFEKVTLEPDLVFFDGQGIAHPRGLGLASHLGLIIDCPAIGCAKTRLTGQSREPGIKKGSRSRLVSDDKATIGYVVRTRENCKPVYVSVGHRIDLDSAVQWTLKCTTRYRIPEPTRLAHNRVNVFRKSRS